MQRNTSRTIIELALLSISFLVFLVLGVPVSFALGLSCVLTYLYEGLPAATAMQWSRG
ncbi:MAG: TRAP-type C4-dicarboxylate transport system, large permease component [uncultured Paraburkholderia sp.]|nr:MAG: TRAP-type C4-dicarboxylate transport system, large permease component [uncultured Paraburkholderia sp.]